MKKSYISPDATIVNLDIEGICQTGSTGAPKGAPTSANNGRPKGEPATSSDNEFSGSYRSSLWGD